MAVTACLPQLQIQLQRNRKSTIADRVHFPADRGGSSGWDDGEPMDHTTVAGGRKPGTVTSLGIPGPLQVVSPGLVSTTRRDRGASHQSDRNGGGMLLWSFNTE